MNIPGFMADVSLHKTSGIYQTGKQVTNSSPLMSPIYPAMIARVDQRKGEVQ